MVDFISEVQEELRKDDYNRWLKKYGPLLAVLVVLVVAGTGYLQWRDYQATLKANATSFDFIKTVDSIDTDKVGAIEDFKAMSATVPEGYAGLSLLRAAELELSSDNADKALVLFDQAASVFSRKRHSHLAQLKAGYIVASQGDYDGVISRMTPLIVEGEPFEFLARELIGFAYKQKGDLQTARSHFSAIELDLSAPESLVARAKKNLILLNQEASMPAENGTVAPETAPQDMEQPDDAEGVTPQDDMPTETPDNE